MNAVMHTRAIDASLIQLSNSHAKSPVFFAAPGTPSSHFVPSK